MANQHIRTAASNLQNAAQDMREEEQHLRADITQAKQQALTSIKMLKTQADQLERRKRDDRSDANERTAIDRQQKAIKNEIAEIEKNTKLHEQAVEKEISDMKNKESEFNNLASRLDVIA
jgi:chromosome segregation ATPase